MEILKGFESTVTSFFYFAPMKNNSKNGLRQPNGCFFHIAGG